MVIKDCMDEDYKCVEGELIIIHKNKEVNTHWWETLKNPTKIEIIQAYEDGAKIRIAKRLCTVANPKWKECDDNIEWCFQHYIYDIIKPVKHIIKIDDKEIEISEESYDKLKESLI